MPLLPFSYIVYSDSEHVNMAKTTSKKKAVPAPVGSLLNFFSKSPVNGTTTTKRRGSVKEDSGLERKPSLELRGKGKEKEAVDGSSMDPVVISDDEEPRQSPRTTESKKRRLSPPVHAPEIVDVTSSPGAGPSRLPLRSPSPLPGHSKLPPPIAGLPEFEPPPTWPQIVNTAEIPGGDEEEEDDDEDAIPPSDPEDGREDGEDPPEESGAIAIDIDEEPEIEIMPIETPTKLDAGGSGAPFGGAGSGIDFDMEWNEGDDEGMGMEEEGDEEASEIVETPPLLPKGKKGGKVDRCPVCGKSMKGKVDKVSYTTPCRSYLMYADCSTSHQHLP